MARQSEEALIPRKLLQSSVEDDKQHMQEDINIDSFHKRRSLYQREPQGVTPLNQNQGLPITCETNDSQAS